MDFRDLQISLRALARNSGENRRNSLIFLVSARKTIISCLSARFLQ
jgi:hypothetical protein